jgi:short-subunit dehydrogenase
MKKTNPIAIITGASTGIGKYIAIELSKHAFEVILIARDKKKLLEVQRIIQEEGNHCLVVPADVSDPSSIKNIISKINNPENVEVVVNNAGIGIFDKIQNMSLKDWDMQINTNLRGAFLITQLFVPFLIKKKTGKILFMNSVAGLSPFPFSSAYVASKYGLRGFSSALREELREHDIKVISVHPGAVDTPLWDKAESDFPRDEMMSAKDVSNMAVSAILAPNNVVCEEVVIRRTAGDF